MFFRILKKDLKRKKTMNIVLLLFVVMCSMLAAVSVNNIIAVTRGVDYFVKISDAPDVIVEVPYGSDTVKMLEDIPSVSKVEELEEFFLMPNLFRLDGSKMDKLFNGVCFFSIADTEMNFFDENDRVIKSVPQGSFYCTGNFLYETDTVPGDILEIDTGSGIYKLRYEGRFKSAVHSYSNSASPMVMLNKADWEELSSLTADITPMRTGEAYVTAADTETVVKAAEDASLSCMTKDDYQDIFLYDKLTAYILLAVCVLLVITAFAALRFAIGSTISEEFREIGVMKAVGISNSSIRGLYLTKYAAISVIGSLAGSVASIPLSDVMLRSVSKNMVFESSGTMTGLIGSLAVVAAMLLFSFGCTRGIKKLTPIDAVRSGQTGERFGRKSVMHLGRSKLPATGFLALNDVMSAPRQFIIITIVFTFCVLMMTIMSNFANTLSSDKPISMFEIPVTTDLTVLDSMKGVGEVTVVRTGEDGWKTVIEKTEKLLADNDMPGKCTVQMGMVCPTECGGRTENLCYIVNKNCSAADFPYDSGSAPMKTDECAMTELAMEKLGARIGDRVKMTIMGEEREYLITGSFSSFMASGDTVRLNEEDTIDYNNISTFMGVQIDFDKDLTPSELEEYKAKLMDITGTRKTYTNAELVDTFTEMSGTMNSLKKAMMIITVIVTALIVILMERSFVTKETSEIALMKAVGLKGGSIIGQHVLRFLTAAVAAAGIASAAVLPISRWLINFIFSMIGSSKGVDIAYDAVEIFGICPAILIAVTLAGTFLTSLGTKSIKAADTASIE